MRSVLRPTRQLLPSLISHRLIVQSTLLPRRFSSSTAGSQADTHDLPSSTTPNSPSTDRSHQTASSSSSSSSSELKDSKDAQNLADQLAQKDAQLNEYKDLYIRARADFENLQKITTREKAQAKDYAIQNFARDLVSNIDVLQLALNSVPEGLRRTNEEAKTDSDGSSERKHLVDLWGGVQSTKNLLEKTLARYGVVPFDPTDHLFDPNRHEAMYQAQAPGKEPNSVINCSKVGWMLRDRVLRPAQVGVAQGPSESP